MTRQYQCIYHAPNFIKNNEHLLTKSRKLQGFEWFDWKASDSFQYDADQLLSTTKKMTPRAQVSLAIGFYEWILWSLYRESDLGGNIPLFLSEASWCANISPYYMDYFELERTEWLGHIRGPLWCAITWLIPMIYYQEEGEEELESGIEYLSSLAFHVCPIKTQLQEWLSATVNKFLIFFHRKNDSPLDNVFGDKDTGGNLISKEFLDPNSNLTPSNARSLLNTYLTKVNHKENILLNSSKKMLDEGFIGNPYELY